MLSISLNLYQGLAVACLVYALGYLICLLYTSPSPRDN